MPVRTAVITLVLGGVRSGKSEVAEHLAGPGPGTYLATALVAPDDDDFAARVARHRARRPAAWATVEEPRAVPAVLARLHGPVLVDALGTWVANEPRPDLDALVDALVCRRGDTIIVSEEVGLGVHPMTEAGRAFADRLGEANRRVAAIADRCLLVVAGRIIELPAGPPLAHPVAGGTVTPSVVSPPAAPGPTGSAPASPTPGPTAAAPGRSGSAPPPASPGTGPTPLGPPHAAPTGDPSTSGHSPTAPTTPSAPPPVPPGSKPAAFGRQSGGPAAGGLRQAVAFLTPVGGAAGPTPAALVWFPVVGAVLGLALGGLWWGTDDRLGPLAAAALVVAADLALTGALHFDGLLDAADGLLPHLPRERRLTVMADPHVGAFGVATGAAALLLRTAALAAFATTRPLLLAALWAASRTAMAVTTMTGRYARSHGLASSFLPPPAPPSLLGTPPTPAPATAGVPGPPTGADRPPAGAGSPHWLPPWALTAGAGTVLAVGFAIADDPRSLFAVVAAALAAAGVAALARRRIGGFSGDTLGAGGVVAETAGLLIALAAHA